MFQEDPGQHHIPSEASAIVALYESTNQPFVQPTGRAAQAAHAAVAALAQADGTEVWIALSLTQSGENVVYRSEAPALDDAELSQHLEEAVLFAESMGFMLDNVGWAQIEEERRVQLLERMPGFHPPAESLDPIHAERIPSSDPLAAVARLLATFGLVLALALGAACSGPSQEQKTNAANIHQELAKNLLSQGNSQEALQEFLQAEALDPDLPEVHDGLGLIYAYSLPRPVEAERHFKRAIELDPKFSAAMNNLGAFYLGRGRFAEAVPLFRRALQNPLYADRVVAESNLGWALYKTGQTDQAIDAIRRALITSPKYCLGWRQLGFIYSERNQLPEASEAFARYAQACPDVPDAHLQAGKTLARRGLGREAQGELKTCAANTDARAAAVVSECGKLLRDLGGP